MQHRNALTLLAMAAALSAGPLAAQTAMPASPGTSTRAAAPVTAQDFVAAAAHSGHAEIQAARLALQRDLDDGLDRYAQRLIDDHQRANAQLQALAARKQLPLPAGPSEEQQRQLRELSSLQGEEFQARFVEVFGLDAHRKTIERFRHETRTGRDADLVQFARDTLPTLEEHLREAQRLQSSLQARGVGGGAMQARTGSVDAEAVRDAQGQIDAAVQAVQEMKRDPRVTAELERARGIFILPHYGRGALGVGVQAGEGVLVTRRDGEFGNPVFYDLAGVSIGAQAGGSGGPVAMLLMTDRAVRDFASGKTFSLDADAGLTIADFSRRAQASGGKVQDVLVWSGTQGAYAGASVGVTRVSFDGEDNAAYYGRDGVTARQILDGKVESERGNVLGRVLGV